MGHLPILLMFRVLEGDEDLCRNFMTRVHDILSRTFVVLETRHW